MCIRMMRRARAREVRNNSILVSGVWVRFHLIDEMDWVIFELALDVSTHRQSYERAICQGWMKGVSPREGSSP